MATNVGVIIGRFELDDPHPAHRAVIDEVKTKHESVYVILGVPAIPLSVRYPLDFAARRRMIQNAYPDIEVLPIKDQQRNETWKDNLDRMISDVEPHAKVTLYGGRDSFIKRYEGRFETVELEIPNSFSGFNATEVRERVGNTPLSTTDFRCGVIFGTRNRRPIIHPTVDVAILSDDDKWVLLGHKPGERQYVFPGGFVDLSKDGSFEDAAYREVREETSAAIDKIRFITTMKMDDWRYWHEQDKIFTTFFEAKLFGYDTDPVKEKSVQAGDDLDSVHWVKISNFSEHEGNFANNDQIAAVHRPLMCALVKHLKQEKRFHNESVDAKPSTDD